MTDIRQAIAFLFFFTICAEILARPPAQPQTKSMQFRGTIPSIRFFRNKRAEGEGQGGGPGIMELLTTAVKDGIASSSVMESPTMVVGGFSIMMQPMPKGSDVANQLMEMAPHYMSLLPGLPGLPGTGGTGKNSNEK